MAVSVPGYVKRSCGFACIRPVPGRLWGVFNTPLHGDENGTRGMSLSVPGYMKHSCVFARIRPVPGRLWGVCNTPLHGNMKRSCGFARIRPVPGRLWGVFNTPLHGDENVTRRMSLSVPGYMKRSCGFCYSSIYRSSPCQFSGLMMMYSEIR